MYKRRKLDNIKLISATSIKNYMNDNPLSDYLDHMDYNNESVNDLFLNTAMDEGVLFENEIIKKLKENHSIIEATSHDDTIKLIKKGVPIIWQAHIKNNTNGTYGKPDLLVKSTYINTIFPGTISFDKEYLSIANILGLNYYYIPIEIKHSKFKTAKNKQAYKGQMYIYLTAINNMLGTNLSKGYFLCKDNINELITVDYSEDSKDYIIVDKVMKAISWLRDLEEYGYSWSIYPIPSRIELFPNMKVYDKKYEKIKKEINRRIGGDITSLWKCGIKERIAAHNNNIFSLSNKKLNAKLLGFSENNIDGKKIDAILETNRQNKYTISCETKKITYELQRWKNIDNKTTHEFYLDIETFNSKIRVNLDGTPENDYIFLSGIGYIDNNNEWKFEKFMMKNKSRQSEIEAIDNFLDYIKDTLLLLGKEKAILYHWSKFEDLQFKKYYERNQIKKYNFYNFYDLNKVFTEEPITIKGALNFKLKTIGKILYKHDMIETCWDIKNDCCDGLNAMILGEMIYNSNSEDIMKDKNMLDIIQYNEMDCRVLCDIHNLIKKY
jgi:hypothetical protein